jgi:polar amino acid transport system substrate-binding protein
VRSLAAIFFVLLTFTSAFSAARPQHLVVATRVVPPFVFEETGRLTGFSIDLWREIASELHVDFTYAVKPTVSDVLAAVKSNQAALAIAAISITADREVDLDFSQPMFDAGLQIMVRAQPSQANFLTAIAAGIFSSSALPMLGIVLLIILVPAHIVWFFERRNPTGMLAHRHYFPGIFEACWWAASTLATQADQMPRAAVARVVAVVWMFASVVFIAYFTAAVTSNLTLQQLRGDINGPDDLPGKHVATIGGSTSLDYLRRRNIEAQTYPTIEQADEALERGNVDAIVYDTPVLLYYAAHKGNGKVQLVGSAFRKESYGIVFPSESRLRKPVNEALLKLKENGTYDQLYRRWFGGSGS